MQRKFAIAALSVLGFTAATDAATIDTRSSMIRADVSGGNPPSSDGTTATRGMYSESVADSAGISGGLMTQAGALQDIDIVIEPNAFVFAEPTLSSRTGQSFIEALGANAGGSAFTGSASSTLLLQFTVPEGFIANYTTVGQLVYQSTLSNTGINGAEVFLRDESGMELFGARDLTAAADGTTSFSDSDNLNAGVYTVGFNTDLNVEGTLAQTGRADAVVRFSFLVTSTPIPSPTAVLGGGVLLSVLPLRRRR